MIDEPAKSINPSDWLEIGNTKIMKLEIRKIEHVDTTEIIKVMESFRIPRWLSEGEICDVCGKDIERPCFALRVKDSYPRYVHSECLPSNK